MHLADFMAINFFTDAHVAAAIGRSRPSVSRYRRGLVRPDWNTILAVQRWSRGVIQPDDWTEIAHRPRKNRRSNHEHRQRT